MISAGVLSAPRKLCPRFLADRYHRARRKSKPFLFYFLAQVILRIPSSFQRLEGMEGRVEVDVPVPEVPVKRKGPTTDGRHAGAVSHPRSPQEFQEPKILSDTSLWRLFPTLAHRRPPEGSFAVDSRRASEVGQRLCRVNVLQLRLEASTQNHLQRLTFLRQAQLREKCWGQSSPAPEARRQGELPRPPRSCLHFSLDPSSTPACELRATASHGL